MRKIFTSLFLVLFALFANAQYYVPNSGFENWKGVAGSTYQSSDGSFGGGSSALGLSQRPGDEPSEWEGSSINQTVGMNKKETLVEKSESYNGSTAVKLTNKDVKVMGIGSTAPGFISFATPWVYAISKVENCDGGVYGGIGFKGRPDAIKGRFNRTGGTGEKAHIIAYIWKGTFKSNIKSSLANDTKEDVDKAVMGKDTDLMQSGTLIASCDYEFVSTSNWEEIVVPLYYNSDEIPQKMNVILSSGDYWTRGNIKHGSVLDADDVQFVYYSELASLKYNGADYFNSGQASYTINEEYDESNLEVTSNGNGASIEKNYDAASKVLTITVKGGDYEVNNANVHVYTVAFGDEEGGEIVDPNPNPNPDPEPTPGDVDYTPSFTGTKTKGDRWIESITLSSQKYSDEQSNVLSVDNSALLCYNDYAANVTMKAAAGETVTMNVNIGNASWMNAYVYIDADANGFTASIADGSNWTPAGDLVSYSFYNNNDPSDNNGWNSNGDVISGDARSTVALPQFAVPVEPGIYRVRVKMDWCNIDPNGDQDGKFGDFMANGGQIVDFMLEVVGDEVVDPDPEPEPEPEPEPGVVDYTPTFTGQRTNKARYITAVSVGADSYSLTTDEQNSCYVDATGVAVFKVEAGAMVRASVERVGEWMHHAVFVDFDADGFAAGIEEGSSWKPAGDLVAYSFYNNNGSDDNSGWNSVGTAMSGNDRHMPEIPEFAVPSLPGRYRMRFVQDWCSIDPNGDQDSKFGDFMANGGHIVDVILEVVDPNAPETGIGNVEEETVVEGIYDLQGRKLLEISKSGIYVVDGKKMYIRK